MSEIIIRRAETPDEYRALQEAQRRTWGIVDDTYILPVSTMISAQKHGGIVLGAFLPDGRAAGLSFGFLGRIEGRVGLYSQITGVIPEHQGTGLGTRLKKIQRALCLAEGVPVIAWAFDLMRPGNARFNLNRLGARSRRVIPDMYGTRTDALNVGGHTDRLIVEWELDDVPRDEPSAEELAKLPRVIRRDGPGPIFEPVDAPSILVEIPASHEESRDEAMRCVVMQALGTSFAMGYRAIGFAAGGYVLSASP